MYFQPEHYGHVPLPDDSSGPLPVVVVGGGPVGLATALGLAQRGIRVTVLAAGDSVCYGSRAICLSRNSLQMLDRLGVGDRFAELSLPWVRGRSHHRDKEVLVLEMPTSETLARPPMVNISQSVAGQVLVEATDATELVSLHWQSRVVGCSDTGDVVSLEVQTPQGTRQLRAQWVVAADGARQAEKSTLFMTPATHGYRQTREAALSPGPQPGDTVEDRLVRAAGSSAPSRLREVTGTGFALLGVDVDPGGARSSATVPTEPPDVASVSDDVQLVETAWRAISGLLDSTPPEQREAALTRLAMLLAIDTGRPDAVTEAVSLAAATPSRSTTRSARE